MNFEELNLPEYLVKALNQMNLTVPTEIQEKCIPAIREGRDAVGTSQTGSGKTFAFGIPAVEMIDDDPYVQVLIVCPTRELTVQVTEEIRKLTKYKEGAKVVPIFGGSSIEKQIFALKKNARIVVGTPGRLLDHIRRKTLKLQKIKLLVLDEADEMLDMGFREDIEDIIKVSSPDRQTVMFSATMPPAIKQITESYMTDPVRIEGETHGKAQTFIDQYYLAVEKRNKNDAVSHLINTFKPMRCIIFCNTKAMVDDLTKAMVAFGVIAVGLHGDMRQSERRKSIDAIKQDRIAVLIATDVAARGIDIKDVDIVINFDIPNNAEYYIHRIGRTARAGKAGAAYTIISGKAQLGVLDGLMRQTKNEIKCYQCELSTTYAMPKKPVERKEVFRKGKTHVTSSSAKSKKRFSDGDGRSEGKEGREYKKSDFAPRAKRADGDGKSRSEGKEGREYKKSDFAPRAKRADGDGKSRSEGKEGREYKKSDFAPRAKRADGDGKSRSEGKEGREYKKSDFAPSSAAKDAKPRRGTDERKAPSRSVRHPSKPVNKDKGKPKRFTDSK